MPITADGTTLTACSARSWRTSSRDPPLRIAPSSSSTDESSVQALSSAFAWVRASAKSRAFWMAAPAWAASMIGHGLVSLGEVAAVALLGEVQVPEDAAARDHWHPEERPHRRVVRREADRARIGPDVGEPQRPGVGDEHAQDPPAGREVADGGALVVAETGRDELGQLVARLVEHADRPVPRPRQIARELHETRQDLLKLEPTGDRHAGVENGLETIVWRRGAHSGRIRDSRNRNPRAP